MDTINDTHDTHDTQAACTTALDTIGALPVIVPANFTEFKAISEYMTRCRTALQSVGQTILLSAYQELFAQYPDLESVSWYQFSAYFNDGDECPFYVHSENMKTEFYGSVTDEDEVWQAAYGILNTFDDDDLYNFFDNHAQITITREGVTVTEYTSHD